MDQFIAKPRGKLEQVHCGKLLLSLPKMGQPRPNNLAARLHGMRHSKERDREAVSYHYDQSKDFFALWLDRHMIYSCGYFATPDDDLDTALAISANGFRTGQLTVYQTLLAKPDRGDSRLPRTCAD